MLSQEGIFSRAEKATDKYGQAKARETLELALGEAQMQKYEEGLTDEQLNNQIAKIDGELLPKEKPNPNLQNVIVDGYIFEIDRSVPKIVDYIGPADGIVITAYVTGNDGWVKPDETVTVKGSIKKYGDGSVTSSSATATNGVTIPTDFPANGGSFTIPNISVDTDITITATDSDGETVNKKIEVRIKRDGTAPTVETLVAKAEGMIIIFTATGHDRDASGQEGSGIKNFNYEITSTEDTSLEGIPADKRTGTFTPGQTVEIETTKEVKYSIKVKAVDNCGNISESKTQEVTTEMTMTLAEAKEKVRTNTLQRYIGTKITDYNPDEGGTWRVFYYDETGYFGETNALYLKRDSDSTKVMTLNTNSVTEDGTNMMRKMNPKCATTSYNKIDTVSKKAVVWLCDPNVWTGYKTDEASFAIASPSLEMWIKAYNVWKQNNPNGNALTCARYDEYGYSITHVGESANSGNMWANYIEGYLDEKGFFKGIGKSNNRDIFLSSTGCDKFYDMVYATNGRNIYDHRTSGYICPIACISN